MSKYVLTIKKDIWFDDSEEKLHLTNHIESFFKDECESVSIDSDFDKVTIETTKEREYVERMVLIFNRGHTFDIAPLNPPASIAIELVLN